MNIDLFMHLECYELSDEFVSPPSNNVRKILPKKQRVLHKEGQKPKL